MAYCCSQCSFSAQFESALMMHHQLHHDADDYPVRDTQLQEKSHTLPRVSPPSSPFFRSKNKGTKCASNIAVLSRTSSATKLFDRLKARITKSRTLFSHPEEPGVAKNLSIIPSDCTSNKTYMNKSSVLTTLEDHKETFACHLCTFDADRITVLDRHLLNDHKLGLENLLKLVMAKTKDGLAEDKTANFGIRQPYYKVNNEIIEEGEFIIETVTPRIKILKHAATNTDNDNIIDIKDKKDNRDKDNELINNFKDITKEIEHLLGVKVDDDDLMGKMKTINEYMCKFVDSSNALKKVLNKELDLKEKERSEELFNSSIKMGLGDTPRNWERAHSDNIERNRNKYPESGRGEKSKTPSDSFYF